MFPDLDDPQITFRVIAHIKPGLSPDECWPYTGHLNESGYGVLSFRRNGQQKLYRAHRVALAASGVPVRPDDVVRHACDNPPCCNPRHLSVGTAADNFADMVERGRYSPPPVGVGERNGQAKLTEDQVRRIKRVFAAGAPRGTIAALARTYGVSESTISFIKRGKKWQHISF